MSHYERSDRVEHQKTRSAVIGEWREIKDQEAAEKVCDDAKAMCKRINDNLENDNAGM